MQAKEIVFEKNEEVSNSANSTQAVLLMSMLGEFTLKQLEERKTEQKLKKQQMEALQKEQKAQQKKQVSLEPKNSPKNHRSPKARR